MNDIDLKLYAIEVAEKYFKEMSEPENQGVNFTYEWMIETYIPRKIRMNMLMFYEQPNEEQILMAMNTGKQYAQMLYDKMWNYK